MKKHFPFIAALLCLLLLCGCGEAKRIKSEIFEYVLQNEGSIEPDPLDNYVSYEYRHTGSDISSVDYGYYYTEDDDYEFPGGRGKKYKGGFRLDNINNDPTDWYYTEKICDNWYYYELHDG